MKGLQELLRKQEHMTRQDLIDLLSLTDPADLQALYEAAYAVKTDAVGNIVYYRGLIEFSNRCIKNCDYCGIRRENKAVKRFDTAYGDILAMARWTYENGYGSLTLQAGERQDERFIAYMERLIKDIKKIGDGALGLTLCVGEQSEETYKRWFAAGAHRYLLRIESSNPRLYGALHPHDGNHEWDVRYDCLQALRRVGYQVGTGNMIGLPGQTVEDLADDILFYRQEDIDMIGMGPYVTHHNTPVGKAVVAAGLDSKERQAERLRLGLIMIAVTRLFLKDCNIAATTALQALHPFGRELGLKAGANILMPIVTLPRFRGHYLLYDNKPCIDDTPGWCRSCLGARVAAAGDTVGFGRWGDSPHFFNRTQVQKDGP